MIGDAFQTKTDVLTLYTARRPVTNPGPARFCGPSARTMEGFSEFPEKMKATPDGAGNLLDTFAAFGTSCVAGARSHQHDRLPILIAGKAGGRLLVNVHYRSGMRENTTNILIGLHNRYGATIAELGIDVAKSNQPGPSAVFA